APDGPIDDLGARSAIAVERHGVDYRPRSQPAGRRDDGLAERDRGLANRGELDRVTARPLDLPTHSRRHPQRQVGGVHDRVDFEFADVAVPEFDPSQRVSCGGNAREPGGPAGASYTRVNRPDIAVTTSQEF